MLHCVLCHESATNGTAFIMDDKSAHSNGRTVGHVATRLVERTSCVKSTAAKAIVADTASANARQ